MTTVYLVRHGESETNAGTIMFGKSAKLTARGHEQAKFIARRCARLPVEVIIRVVSYERTRRRDTSLRP